jgi:hypothetical protein
VPLLKDMFAGERRKAKILNFSIAYGKTAHGLARDWGVTIDEANDTVRRWYSDRPEVRLVLCVEVLPHSLCLSLWGTGRCGGLVLVGDWFLWLTGPCGYWVLLGTGPCS